jgi:uncharacterized protein (TIGR03089 family)
MSQSQNQTFARSAQTPADLLRSSLEVDPARPVVTFYDDASGERVELSVKTLDNWVAKTANLLQDDLSAAPGDRAAVLLPAHWQTAIWLLACWSVGVTACLGGDPAGADLAISGPDTLDAAAECPGERVALALRPLGARFPQLPAGFLDYATEVPAQGDRFVPYAPVDPERPALEIGGAVLTGAQVTAGAGERAVELGLAPGARVMSTLPYDTWEGLTAGLLAPLAAGASVVLCRNSAGAGDPALDDRAAAERVTHRIG